jgi:tRNA U34 5-carboxymethylaminomethyl modifying enzyme MnmG/GidA
MCSAPLSTNDPDIWIEFTPSQEKFEPCAHDLKHDRFDPSRLTFEIKNFSKPPKPDKLHIAFIPILRDRGVPADTIQKIIVDNLDRERDSMLQALKEPIRFRKWINEQHRAREEANREKELGFIGSLPALSAEKIILMLEVRRRNRKI